MEITIILDEDEEEMFEELLSQYCYFIQRELNEEELERLKKFVFVRGMRNHLEIWASSIFAMGGFRGSDFGWRNFSEEELEEDGWEESECISEC